MSLFRMANLLQGNLRPGGMPKPRSAEGGLGGAMAVRPRWNRRGGGMKVRVHPGIFFLEEHMSKKFTVAISRPIIVTQYTEIEIEADSEQEAKERAQQADLEAINPQWHCSDGDTDGWELPTAYLDEEWDSEETIERLSRVSIDDVYETGTK